MRLRHLAAAVAFVLAGAACGSDDTTEDAGEDTVPAESSTAADSASSTSSVPATAPPATQPSNVAKPEAGLGGDGAVGDAFTVANSDGAQLSVRLTEVLDPAPVGPNDVIPNTIRLVGLVFALNNPGAAPIPDAPSNSVQLALKGGQAGMRFSVSGGRCGAQQPLVNVAPGQTTEVCVVLSVPPGSSLDTATYGISTGGGRGVARWKLA